jgi:hypothetical protein
MKTKRRATRTYTEAPIPAPSLVRELVAAFSEEIVKRHDEHRDTLRDVQEDAEYASERLTKTASLLNRTHACARAQGKNEDDERLPGHYLETELVAFRGALLLVAEHLGVPHDYGMDNLLTSADMNVLVTRMIDRWQRVCNAATRHGWRGEDGLPEEHLDAELTRWKARSLAAEQDADHYSRPRAKAGD